MGKYHKLINWFKKKGEIVKKLCIYIVYTENGKEVFKEKFRIKLEYMMELINAKRLSPLVEELSVDCLYVKI